MITTRYRQGGIYGLLERDHKAQFYTLITQPERRFNESVLGDHRCRSCGKTAQVNEDRCCVECAETIRER